MVDGNLITPEFLREVLHYSPETGEFRWLITLSKRNSAGNTAGRWNHGYREITIHGRHYRAHRLAFLYMIGRWPIDQVDHINGVREDNRWANLRESTLAENNRNVGMKKNNKCGVKGVYWHKAMKRWCARIMVNREVIILGYFDDLTEAGKAYRKAAPRYHKEFARVQ